MGASFKGTYYHSVDPKGRLIIPAKLREVLGDACVITTEVHDCLSIFTMDSWDALEEKLLKLPRSKSRLVRHYTENAMDVTFDKQGRVMLTPNQREKAGIEKEVVLIGMIDHIEIWDKEAYEHEQAVADDISKEDLMAELDELGI